VDTGGREGEPYLPLAFEGFQIHELSGNSLIAQIGFVLLQQAAAQFGILRFRD